MEDRVLLFSGFYGVRLPDGRRLLEKAPVGQIVEGRNPGPFGLSVGSSSTFRVLNLGNGLYVLQYGPDQIPITLYYQNQLEGLALESFEGPFVSDTGIMPVGMNQGGYFANGKFRTLYPPTAAQPDTALPGYAENPTMQETVQQAVRDRDALNELTAANAAAGIQQDFTPPELRNPVDPLPPVRRTGQQSVSTVSPGASTDVYYMQSAPGGAIVDTSTPQAAMPAGISPVAVAGAMVLLFLFGNSEE